MKKFSILLLLSLITLNAWATTYTYFYNGKLKYRYNYQEEATYQNADVVGLSAAVLASSDSLDLIIPSTVTYAGKVFKVRSVIDSTFMGNKRIRSVIIRYGTSKIGLAAFKNCSNMAYLRLPSSMESMGYDALVGCNKLTRIYCTAYTPPTIINSDAQSTLPSSVQNVYLSKALTDAQRSAYSSDAYWGGSKATFTNSSYAYDVFCSDGGLFVVKTAPVDSTTIGEVTLVGFDSDGSKVVDGAFTPAYGYDKYGDHYTFENYRYYFVDIADSACAVNSSLKALNLQNVKTLTSIGKDAFYGCFYLTSATMNDGLQTIGNEAFRASGITSFNVPSSVTSIGKGAFTYCTALTELFLDQVAGKSYAWSGQFYGSNATGFKCYVLWDMFYSYNKSIKTWSTLGTSSKAPVDQLYAYFRFSASKTISFSLSYPVNWSNTGIKAYIVKQYTNGIAKTQQVTGSSSGQGLILADYTLGQVYKLPRLDLEPAAVNNLLVGNPDAEVDVYQKSVGYLYDGNHKYFWRPTSSSSLPKGRAYLQILPLIAGSKTKIYVDVLSLKGDVNGDDKVDTTDLSLLISKILNNIPSYAADVNADGNVDTTDISVLMSIILGS